MKKWGRCGRRVFWWCYQMWHSYNGESPRHIWSKLWKKCYLDKVWYDWKYCIGAQPKNTIGFEQQCYDDAMLFESSLCTIIALWYTISRCCLYIRLFILNDLKGFRENLIHGKIFIHDTITSNIIYEPHSGVLNKLIDSFNNVQNVHKDFNGLKDKVWHME